MSEVKKPFKHLPRDVLPSNYALRIRVDLTNFTFHGHEEVTVEVAQTKSPVKSIILNCAELKIQHIKYDGCGQKFENVGVIYDKDAETVTVDFPEALKVGKGRLSLEFEGTIRDETKGFYRTKYAGEDTYNAITQFEPTDARRAFPCWDEPDFKATFDITLVVTTTLVALSNMPVKSTKPLESDKNWKVVEFEQSKIMSTYLVAYAVGKFDYVEMTDSNGVVNRVYTQVGKKEQGQFALEVSVKTLPFYKNYFGIAYPLPKVDLIAIADFAAGAMENWGLVTYRETALLVDEKQSSAASKQWVAHVVGHELAHQWFGDLVTMKWWTHLWLNEGFASWIEYLCVDYCFPEYQVWTQFALDFNTALELDSLKNSHPIEVEVKSPEEINEIFDTISYKKGSSVIRMLHDYIGDEKFKTGLNKYLEQHKFQNAETDDLWKALGEASGDDISKMMHSWTKQMGYPVLEVHQQKTGNQRVLTISQTKFNVDGSKDDHSHPSLWAVPLSVSTASCKVNAIPKTLLTTANSTVTVDNVKNSDWIKLNSGNVGFYRTLYPKDMLDALLPAILDKSLPVLDRLGLENDIFALTRAGKAGSVDFLEFINNFKGETDYTIWVDVCSNLETLSVLIENTDFNDKYDAFQVKLLTSIVGKIGWDPKEKEDPLSPMLRSLVIGRSGMAGNKDVIQEARTRFKAHCAGTTSLPADLRSMVYSIVLHYGGDSEYDEMLKLYKSADLQEERVRILESLGKVTDEKLIQKTLDLSLSNDVRSQDTVSVINGVTGSVKGRARTWLFVQKNWMEFFKRYAGQNVLPSLVKGTTSKFVSEDKAKEVEAFFKTHQAPGAERTIQQSLEWIRVNAAQLDRDKDKLKTYLNQH